MRNLFYIVVATTLLLAGCATDPDTPALYVGMSRDRLKVRLGEPIRIERSSIGGEDWYYNFSSPPEVTGASTHDERNHIDSASVGISESLGNQERPVHLSPDGFVIEPLPRGHVVK